MEASQLRAAMLAISEADQRGLKSAITPVLRTRSNRRSCGLSRTRPGAHCGAAPARHRARLAGHTIAGVDGADAVWLLAQHAELADQLMFWPLLCNAVAAGDATTMQLTFLEDRIALRQGRSQYFGTQMIRHGTEQFQRHDTADMDTLEQRRAAIGIGTVSDQLAYVNAP